MAVKRSGSAGADISRGISRRHAMAGLGAAALAGLSAPSVLRAAPLRVAVIGAGAGGASLCKLLTARAGDAVDLTLIDKDPVYTAPFFSERFFGGLWPLEKLRIPSLRCAGDRGVRIIRDHVRAIDRDARQLRLQGGERIAYDFLVASPGIGFRFDAMEGYDPALMPHGWAGEAQLALLRRHLAGMEDGGTVLIAPPQKPYRCPPAPYARATMIARYLQQHKPGSKVLILDAKNKFTLQELFEAEWADRYEDTIEWIPADLHGGITALAAEGGRIVARTDLEDFEADVANVIPPQTAAPLLLAAGLGEGDDHGYCPVTVRMTSRHDGNIYILGDSAATGVMAKSASSARSQARLAAADILRRSGLGGIRETVPGSLCWTALAPDDAIYLDEEYSVAGGRFELVKVAKSLPEDSGEIRSADDGHALQWFRDMRSAMC